jgi:hypothetical protein
MFLVPPQARATERRDATADVVARARPLPAAGGGEDGGLPQVPDSPGRGRTLATLVAASVAYKVLLRELFPEGKRVLTAGVHSIMHISGATIE